MLFMLRILAMSLISTIVYELLFAFACKITQNKELMLVVLVNILTNPCVVFLYYASYYYTDLNRILVIAVLEVSAVVVEWLCYKGFSKTIRHPFLFSLGANAFSYCIGLIVNQLL